MYQRMIHLSAALALSIYSLASAASTPPMTVVLQNSTIGANNNAYYLVSLDPSVPQPGLNHLALIGGIPRGAKQISGFGRTPCGVSVPFCSKPAFALSPGAQCCLGIQLAPAQMSVGLNILQPIVGSLPEPSTYSVQAQPVEIKIPAITIVGDYTLRNSGSAYPNDPAVPLGYYTDDKFISWRLSNPIQSNVNNNTYLNSISCGDTKKLCVAVGAYKKSATYVPVSYFSSNGGKDWVPSLNHFASNFLYSVSCSKSGQSCIALGNTSDRTAPVTFISNNHGQTWMQTSGIMNNSGGNYFNMQSIACDKEIKACTAVGFYRNTNSYIYPVTYYTTNGGASWTRSDPTPANLTDKNYLNSIACDHTAQSCVAVGNYRTSIGAPLAYFTQNGGMSWTQSNSLVGISRKRAHYLNGVACSKNGLNCSAVGSSLGSAPAFKRLPLSYYTHDGGQTWFASAALPLPAHWTRTRRLNAVSCDAQGTMCSAVGFVRARNISAVPFGYLSINGGQSWSLAILQEHKPYTNFLNSIVLREMN